MVAHILTPVNALAVLRREKPEVWRVFVWRVRVRAREMERKIEEDAFVCEGLSNVKVKRL